MKNFRILCAASMALCSCASRTPVLAYNVKLIDATGAIVRNDTVKARVYEHLKYRRVRYIVNGYPVTWSGDYLITVIKIK